MARTRLVQSADGPHLTRASNPRTRGQAQRRHLSAPAVTPDEIRERVLAMLRAHPSLAPKDDAEKAASAADVFRAPRDTPRSTKTQAGGRRAQRGRPATAPGVTPGTPVTKTGGDFPAAVAI